MIQDTAEYQSPLATRYASPAMLQLFSPYKRAYTWRLLWLQLAKEQQKLGFSITDQQIEEMEKNMEEIDFARIEELEKQIQHDVMAHIHAFGEVAPQAKGIIHLGATSCYVTDNADLILYREALQEIKEKMVSLLSCMKEQAEIHAHLPTTAYTHLQPAQPTTVGKRIALWAQDLLWDCEKISSLITSLPFLGAKGATGTQASFLSLFDEEEKKVETLDQALAQHFAFPRTLSISGQTYPRKIDADILHALSGVAASLHKMCTDLRLLCHMGEFSEPNRALQVGSSAMPYKQNPMMSERCCSLARVILSLQQNGDYTASLQWLERSLDDSAGRRIYMPEAFLCADALINLATSLIKGCKWHKTIIEKNLSNHLPFFATEDFLVQATQKGADRQVIHEELRRLSKQAMEQVKETGVNPLLSLIEKSPLIPLQTKELQSALKQEKLIGQAPKQTLKFLQYELAPFLESFQTAKMQ